MNHCLEPGLYCQRISDGDIVDMCGHQHFPTPLRINTTALRICSNGVNAL